MQNAIAHKLMPLVDLTSLKSEDTEHSITLLCQKALTITPKIASVCVFSKFIPLTKKILKENLNITTVVNFPKGDLPTALVLTDIKRAIDLGADEIDVVIPYQHYLSDSKFDVSEFTKRCADICNKKVVLKTILETGVLQRPTFITKACEDVIAGHTHFIKTSTGKTATGATIDAVTTILEVIKNHQGTTGIKISGGISTTEQAVQYLAVIENIMSPNWITPERVRFGTSKVWDDIGGPLPHESGRRV